MTFVIEVNPIAYLFFFKSVRSRSNEKKSSDPQAVLRVLSACTKRLCVATLNLCVACTTHPRKYCRNNKGSFFLSKSEYIYLWDVRVKLCPTSSVRENSRPWQIRQKATSHFLKHTKKKKTQKKQITAQDRLLVRRVSWVSGVLNSLRIF